MENKVIFLDRDGTINKDFGYVYQKSKLEFLPGVIEALHLLKDAGYKLIIITNQSGIGRGYFSLNDYNEFNQYMIEELKKLNIEIDKVYYCPHTDEDKCNCRKPNIGLFENAIKEYNVDIENSYVIGDNERDLSVCDKYNLKSILLYKNSDKYLCKKDLLDAAKYILQ